MALVQLIDGRTSRFDEWHRFRDGRIRESRWQYDRAGLWSNRGYSASSPRRGTAPAPSIAAIPASAGAGASSAPGRMDESDGRTGRTGGRVGRVGRADGRVGKAPTRPFLSDQQIVGLTVVRVTGIHSCASDCAGSC